MNQALRFDVDPVKAGACISVTGALLAALRA
jgi:hypothetical protein